MAERTHAAARWTVDRRSGRPGPVRRRCLRPGLADLFWVGTGLRHLGGGGRGRIGYGLDSWLGTTPWLSFAGLAFGIVSAVLLGWRHHRRFVTERAGALGRVRQRHPARHRASRRTVYSALAWGSSCRWSAWCWASLSGWVGLCIGLGLGIVNFRLTQRSVAKIGASAATNKRRPLATNTLGRLGLMTIVALGLLFLSWDLGLGTMAGLAVFQFLLLVNVARSVLKAGPHGRPGRRSACWTTDDDDQAPATRVPEMAEPTKTVPR